MSSQLALFESEVDDADDQGGPHDVLVFRLVELAEDIKRLPLAARAQFATMIDCELQPVVSSTFTELQSKPCMLQSWAAWAHETYPSHFTI